MKFLKTLFWLGAIAAAVPLLKKLLAGESAPVAEGTSPVVPVIEKTLEKHAGEDSPIVQAFAHAVEEAKHDAPAAQS